MNKNTIGIIIGNRDFFPDHLITQARKDILDLFKKNKINPIILPDQETKNGGVETYDDAEKCSKELRNCLGATLPMDTFDINIIDEETIEERLMGIHGEHVVIVDENEIEVYDYDFSDKAYTLSDEVKMNCTFNVNYTSTSLEFRIEWNSLKVARKDAIENRLVELPLHIMAKIQYLIEDALISIKADFPINDATIDCKFESINYTQSECAPDIIQLVKDAKEEIRKEA